MSEFSVDQAAGKAQRIAQVAEWLVWAAIAIIALSLANDMREAAIADLEALRGADAASAPFWPQNWPKVLDRLIWALPPILMTLALMELRAGIGEFARGAFFSAKAARAVRNAGGDGVAALLGAILIAPSLSAWVLDEGVGLVWRVDAIDLSFLAFAAFIALIGHVLDLAIAVKAENDEIV